MDGEKADMCFTDPPYGVAIGSKNAVLNSVQPSGRCCENIENDTLSADELYDVLKEAMTNVRENCKDDSCYFVTSPQGGGSLHDDDDDDERRRIARKARFDVGEKYGNILSRKIRL